MTGICCFVSLSSILLVVHSRMPAAPFFLATVRVGRCSHCATFPLDFSVCLPFVFSGCTFPCALDSARSCNDGAHSSRQMNPLISLVLYLPSGQPSLRSRSFLSLSCQIGGLPIIAMASRCFVSYVDSFPSGIPSPRFQQNSDRHTPASTFDSALLSS